MPKPQHQPLDYPPIELSELPASETILRAAENHNPLHLTRTVATLCRRVEALERQLWGLEDRC